MNMRNILIIIGLICITTSLIAIIIVYYLLIKQTENPITTATIHMSMLSGAILIITSTINMTIMMARRNEIANKTGYVIGSILVFSLGVIILTSITTQEKAVLTSIDMKKTAEVLNTIGEKKEKTFDNRSFFCRFFGYGCEEYDQKGNKIKKDGEEKVKESRYMITTLIQNTRYTCVEGEELTVMQTGQKLICGPDTMSKLYITQQIKHKPGMFYPAYN